jgi:hypothetical protein
MSGRTSTPGEKGQPRGATGVFAEPRYVWIFQCSRRATLRAATLDRRGRNLPTNLCQGGTWTVSGQLTVGSDQSSRPGIDITALKIGIEQDGFYLWSTEMEPPPEPLRPMR